MQFLNKLLKSDGLGIARLIFIIGICAIMLFEMGKRRAEEAAIKEVLANPALTPEDKVEVFKIIYEVEDEKPIDD